MLNRNAEALFWIGRYMERAENHARLIDVHYHLQQEGDFLEEGHKWARLIGALGARDDYCQQFDTFSEKDVLSFITLDRGYTNSLFSCVSHARNNLRTIREKLPSELWDMLNSFYLWLGEKSIDDILTESPHPFYTQIKEQTAMFQGAEHSVMQRGNEWQFIESGRHLERAENTLRILKSVAGAIHADRGATYPYLQGVLRSVSGYQAFRQKYADGVTVERIMEFFITDSLFPRSVYFAFSRLEEHLGQIHMHSREFTATQHKAIRQAVKTKATLACLEPDEMSIRVVDSLLDRLLQDCHQLGLTVAAAFFRFEEVSA